MIRNGTFTEGWQERPLLHLNLLNQQPAGWRLVWIEPGRLLYDDHGFQARAVPECVHKHADELPPNERPGGPDALILAGETTYKIFHSHAPFGAALSQAVTALQPGSSATLTVPIQAHLHNDGDPWTLESGVWVNGEGGWANAGQMGDRRWYHHRLDFTVPPDGRAEIVIRFKSKWGGPKDFFIDNVTLEGTPVMAKEVPLSLPEAGSKGIPQPLLNPHTVTATAGLNLRHSPDLDHDPLIRLPEGTRVNVESMQEGWARLSAYVSAEWIEPEREEPVRPAGREVGIDVSHWQGKIDWDRMKANGITFAYIKATQGNRIVDSQFERNWREAGRAGIRRGAYHYYENDVSPEEQAAYFAEHAGAGELPPAGDFEDNAEVSGNLREDIGRFLELVEEKFGQTPAVYTRASWWNDRVGLLPGCDRYPLWVAHYVGINDGTPPPPGFRPAIPRGWHTHWLWQWTDRGPGKDYGAQSEGLDIDWMVV